MGPKMDYVLLTIRGQRSVKDLDGARKLHNETAGSEQGIAACRSLGDLSHKVYVAAQGGEKFSDSKSDELFFMDVWKNAEGLQQFFSNPVVVEQGGRLFTEKDPSVWMPAVGAFAFHLPPTNTRPNRYVGILRGTAKNPEQALAALSEGVKGNLAELRKKGQLSHELFVKLGPPSADGSAEILGYDVWSDLDGMLESYAGENLKAMGSLFTGRPSGSIWQQAPGIWNEW